MYESVLTACELATFECSLEPETDIENTVLQIQVYPKNDAPEVSMPQRVAKSDFLLILKIFLTLDDIRPSN